MRLPFTQGACRASAAMAQVDAAQTRCWPARLQLHHRCEDIPQVPYSRVKRGHGGCAPALPSCTAAAAQNCAAHASSFTASEGALLLRCMLACSGECGQHASVVQLSRTLVASKDRQCSTGGVLFVGGTTSGYACQQRSSACARCIEPACSNATPAAAAGREPARRGVPV